MASIQMSLWVGAWRVALRRIGLQDELGRLVLVPNVIVVGSSSTARAYSTRGAWSLSRGELTGVLVGAL